MGLGLYIFFLAAVLILTLLSSNQSSTRHFTFAQSTLWLGFLIFGYILRPNGTESDNGLEIFFIPIFFALTSIASAVLSFVSYRRVIAPLKPRWFSGLYMQHLLFASLPVTLLIVGLAYFSI